MRQRRRDARITVAYPMTGEKTLELDQKLHPDLARVYERIKADPTGIGERFSGTVRDLSVNGAFIDGPPLPLLSRVAMIVEIHNWKRAEAVGWVLWRRTESCSFPGDDGKTLHLDAGFGVVFEWISLEARLEIARRVAQNEH